MSNGEGHWIPPLMSNWHSTQKFDSIKGFLRHCSQTKNVRGIKKLHAHLLRTGLLFISLSCQSKLIFTYTTCLHRNNSKTFTTLLNCINSTDPLPFNMILSDYCRSGFSFLALQTFSFMHTNGIHARVEKSGWLSSVFVGSALVDMYAKLSLINDAAMMFDEIPVKNTVCANALLSGYGEAKLWVEGLDFVRKMRSLNLNCDHFTLSAMLRSCAGLSAIELGRQVHGSVIRKVSDVEADVFLQSSLIEMYGKCGSVEKAWQVFNLAGFGYKGERKRDVVLWTSMLAVCGRNGHFEKVIELYKEMLREGIRPDGVAFVTVISACGHTGHVKLGIKYFESMVSDFGLEPGPEHYSCVVDLLCRAGELEKAWKMVNEMTPKENGSYSISMWGALLNACNEFGNVELGKLAAHKALEMDPHNVGIYVLLSNMYAKFSMWDEIGQLRELMKESGLKKDVGRIRMGGPGRYRIGSAFPDKMALRIAYWVPSGLSLELFGYTENKDTTS
ncbi:hypothetical protein AAG906_000218 [Vitis piasezkii]